MRHAFDDSDDWELDLDDHLVSQAEVHPWRRGSHGKFVITPEGQFLSWATNAAGMPHHDAAAGEYGVNQVMKGEIAPSGAWWVTDLIDPTANVDQWTEKVAPQAQEAGLRPIFHGYAAKVAVKLDTCNRCLNHYEDCTCAPGGDFDSDPLPEPVRDLKGPYQSSFERVIPESRWAWTPA